MLPAAIASVAAAVTVNAQDSISPNEWVHTSRFEIWTLKQRIRWTQSEWETIPWLPAIMTHFIRRTRTQIRWRKPILTYIIYAKIDAKMMKWEKLSLRRLCIKIRKPHKVKSIADKYPFCVLHDRFTGAPLYTSPMHRYSVFEVTPE